MSGSVNPTFLQNLANPPAASPDYWTKQMANMNALQDYNAKQATADAYRQSIDPSTGQVDQGKFNALIAGGPGAWNAGPTMQQSGQAQIAQGDANASQVSGHLAQLKLLNGEMSDLMQSGQPVSHDQIVARLNAIGKEGWLPPQFMNNVTADLNSQPQGADLTGWLRNHFATNLSGQEALQNVSSQPRWVDKGGAFQVEEGNPNRAGYAGPGTVIGKTLTPEGATDLMDVKYPDNTVHQVMRQDLPAELGKGGTVIGPSADSGGPDPLAKLPKPQALAGVMQRESGGQNVNTRILGPDGKPASSASGVYQMVDGTWQEGAALAGIKNPPPRAIMASKADQDAAASALYDKYGLQPWARSAPGAAKTAAAPPATTPPAATTAPPAATTTAALPLPPTPVPPPPGSPFGATAFSQPSTALPAPPSQATAPNTTAAVPAVPTPQKAAAMAIAQRTGRPAPIAGTDGLFVDKNGNVGSGPNAGGLGRRADIPNALLTGVQTAQTTMPPANVLTAGPGAPTTGLPSGAAPPVPPPTAFGSAAFGSAPAAPPAPAAPVVQPPAQAVPPQAGRGAGWSAPPGYVEKVKADVGGYVADQAAYPAVMTRAQNMAHAYEALQQLQSATGKGAQGINDLRSWAQTLGIAPPGAIKEQQLMEVINKYTERAMLDAAGGSGTDLARQMQSQANPNTGLSTPANLELLRNDMGKSLQTMAAYRDQKDKTGTGYLGNRADVAEATDPRGFVWNLYSPTEQASINAEVARDKTGTAANKLHKAIGMSQRLNLQIPGLTAQ